MAPTFLPVPVLRSPGVENASKSLIGPGPANGNAGPRVIQDAVDALGQVAPDQVEIPVVVTMPEHMSVARLEELIAVADHARRRVDDRESVVAGRRSSVAPDQPQPHMTIVGWRGLSVAGIDGLSGSHGRRQ